MATTVIHGTPTAAPIPGGQWGTGADKTVMSSGGVLSMEGTAKRGLTVRPNVNHSIVKDYSKPTVIVLGAFAAYSMPVYNTDNEELFFRMRVPYRWDGTTNPWFRMNVALSAAEDVGDKFKFQLDWNTTSITGALEADVVTVVHEIPVTTDHSAQYSTYSVAFELDYDNAGLQQTMISRNTLAGRVRRIAAAATQVSNEILVVDWVTTWTVDKMFGNF